MPLRIGDKLHGFRVTRIRDAKELDGRLVEAVFEKTGTQLCWMDNGEENKLFSVTFRTLPEDSTGVFHILEHSVLCGSEKYPLKEPFVALLKSSMNTFLNAMTFPDKTAYPVSSRIDRDFLNLTGVYLDAVFAPRILSRENIFLQEGWHVEPDGEEPSFKGVVFNEMKGAMGSMERITGERLESLLFPDSCYGFNSGGDPEKIPDLTYEAFLDAYRRFYHPSNARVYLDGAVPLEETLALLEEYLEKFDPAPVPELRLQEPVGGEDTVRYALAPEESAEDRGCLTQGKILCSWQETGRILASTLLGEVLTGSNEAPLRKAVLEAGLAEDLNLYTEDGVAQPYTVLSARNVADGRERELEELIRTEAERIFTEGLDRDLVEASLNRLEFRLREPEEPAGLERSIDCMATWLYGGDPMQGLCYENDLAEVRRMAADGGLEALGREILLDPVGRATVHTLPSRTVAAERQQREQTRLREYCADADRVRVAREKLRALQLWQQTPDSREAMESLPKLPLSEVSEDVRDTATEERTECGVRVLWHPVFCRGIVHLNAYFRLTDCTAEELSQLSFAAELFGALPTERYSALELETVQKNTVGHLEFAVQPLAKKGIQRECTPVFAVHCSALREKLPEALELIAEVLLRTDFSDTERITRLLAQTDDRNRMAGVEAGHSVGMTSVLSHYSAMGAVRDAVGGFSALRAIRSLKKHFDEKKADFLALLRRVSETNFCRACAAVSVTAEEYVSPEAFLKALPEGTALPETARYDSALPERMGWIVPSEVGFAVVGSSLFEMDRPYAGSQRVAANLLGLEYLWNTVRVQGGAYGAGLGIGREGGTFAWSYRDPTPAETLELYRGLGEAIRGWEGDEEELASAIISAVAATEPLQSPRGLGSMADIDRLSGYGREDKLRTRREMLRTTREELAATAALWETLAEKGAVCVIGPEEAIGKCKDLVLVDPERV